MMAASRAAQRGRRVLLVEKNRKAGVKILISGGTRCNLTHDCDERGIMAGFGSAAPFLHSPLAALGPRELVAWFEAEGVPTKVEPNGKVFPQSDRALDVVQALVRRMHRTGAELALDEPVETLDRDAEGFVVRTSRRRIRADKLIVATGGRSYPGCGTTGDAYAWLAAWGHTIRPPRPALVPITSADAWVAALAGVTLPAARLRVVAVDPAEVPDRARRRRSGLAPGVLIDRRGPLLFAHFGLTGPVALDVSREVSKRPDPRGIQLRADFLPDTSAEALDAHFRAAAATDGRKQVLSLVPEAVPRRLAEALLSLAGVPAERRLAELGKGERARLIEMLKAAPISVTGQRGFAKAEVTAGGVALDEVDSRTLESRVVPGLYLVGEVLDLDGFLGGYNFQAAFSTGYLAGSSV